MEKIAPKKYTNEHRYILNLSFEERRAVLLALEDQIKSNQSRYPDGEDDPSYANALAVRDKLIYSMGWWPLKWYPRLIVFLIVFLFLMWITLFLLGFVLRFVDETSNSALRDLTHVLFH